MNTAALTNRDVAKGQALAARYGVPRVYGQAEEMLDRERPDLLDSITTPATYRQHIAAARGIDLVVHENFRWQPWYREARRMIDTGLLETLHSVAFRLRPGDGQGHKPISIANPPSSRCRACRSMKRPFTGSTLPAF